MKYEFLIWISGPNARPQDVQAALREQAPKGRSSDWVTRNITLLEWLTATAGWRRPSSCRSSPWVGSQGTIAGLEDISAFTPVSTFLRIVPKFSFCHPTLCHNLERVRSLLICSFIISICELWLWQMKFQFRSRPETCKYCKRNIHPFFLHRFVRIIVQLL